MTAPPPIAARSKAASTISLTILVVMLGAFGNLSLAWGMKHLSITMGTNPLNYLRAMASPFVTLGVTLLILWLLTRMALLSRADLSFVVPATGIGYAVNAILSVWFLKETITGVQWMGTLLIVVGATLVGSERQANSDA